MKVDPDVYLSESDCSCAEGRSVHNDLAQLSGHSFSDVHVAEVFSPPRLSACCETFWSQSRHGI
eukprot:5080154-Karenia_brevis.AAC.1